MAPPLTRTFADPRFRRLIWLLVGALGWAGLVALGLALLAKQPPQAGFDLTLILDAGRRVAAGESPYLAGAVSAGTQVESLFYSYPPPIAQFASVVGGLPNGTVLLVVAAGAVAGFGIVVAGLALGPRSGTSDAARWWGVVDVVLPTLALAPFAYPFAIALLFGNVDAWFPLVYGAVLLASLGGSRRWQVVAGVALGLAVLAKLYPAVLLGWLAVRGLRSRVRDGGSGMSSPPSIPAEWGTLAVAVVTGLVAVGLSLLAGGLDPWRDYIGVLRAGTGADFVSTLNIGPASQLALLAADPSLATRVAPFVAIAAILATAAAAWLQRPAASSLAVATIASLVLSPITWFHYPVALLPFAAWAWIATRDRDARRASAGLIGAAIVVAGVAIAAPIAVWLAVALVVVAVLRASSTASGPAPTAASGGLVQGS